MRSGAPLLGLAEYIYYYTTDWLISRVLRPNFLLVNISLIYKERLPSRADLRPIFFCTS